MTSIEWLKKELEYFGDPDRCIISWEELDSLIEQAERINQKQLIVEIMEEDSKDGLYDIPLQECVNCNEQKQVHLMCLDCCIKLGNQNQTEISEPNPQLIESMSYRYRHDFGLLQDDKKNVIRTIMKQLWEEVVGKGFYKPTKHQVPDVRKMVEWIDREILLNPHYADSPRLKEGANMVKVKLQQYTPTSSQTEISDEEIEKIINPNKLDKIPESWKSFIDGAKWYREQLKQKQ